jgi:hypothetical protein
MAFRPHHSDDQTTRCHNSLQGQRQFYPKSDGRVTNERLAETGQWIMRKIDEEPVSWPPTSKLHRPISADKVSVVRLIQNRLHLLRIKEHFVTLSLGFLT